MLLGPLRTVTEEAGPGDMSALIVVVTGSSGRIAYSLLPFICMGETFGSKQLIHLRLLDIEQCQVR